MNYNLMNKRLMNEAGDIDASGSAVSISDSSSNSYSYANDTSESVITPAAEIARSLGLDPDKYGFGKNTSNEKSGEESQGSDEIEEAGQETDEKSVLDIVNSLGLIHSENPFEVGTKDELKNLIQMGKDYTQKTQSLSEERKAFETEKTSTSTELNSAIQEFNTQRQAFDAQIQELQQWTFAMNQLQEDAPDIFEEVQRAYNGVKKQYDNPIISQELNAIRAELAEAKKGLSQRENKLIVDSFESEFAKLSSTEQSLKELGITIDKEQVKKQWAASGMPVNQVVGSLYFDSLAKAQASKSKVETTKAKLQAKPTGTGGKTRVGTSVPAIDPKLKGVERAQALLNQLRST